MHHANRWAILKRNKGDSLRLITAWESSFLFFMRDFKKHLQHSNSSYIIELNYSSINIEQKRGVCNVRIFFT